MFSFIFLLFVLLLYTKFIDFQYFLNKRVRQLSILPDKKEETL